MCLGQIKSDFLKWKLQVFHAVQGDQNEAPTSVCVYEFIATPRTTLWITYFWFQQSFHMRIVYFNVTFYLYDLKDHSLHVSPHNGTSMRSPSPTLSPFSPPLSPMLGEH
jgi:hypothetical protein